MSITHFIRSDQLRSTHCSNTMFEYELPSVGGINIFWNYTIIDVFSISLTASVHTCQLSRIKQSYELFSDFILGFSHFFSKFQFSLIFIVWFLGPLCTYFITDKDYLAFTIIKANYMMVCTSCKNSYNVLSLSGNWAAGGGGW